MGYVFQDAALLDWLTVVENLLLVLDPDEVRREPLTARSRAAEVLRMVNLPPSVENLRPGQLSGGMRKRVGVARAAMRQVDVMLYDEPTTGLDPKNVSAINESILRVRSQRGATSIVVTHDMSSVAAVADRVALLMGGRIEFHDTASVFFKMDSPAVTDFTGRKVESAGV
jgi:phospholipid/cholesterol/gamma-HCH transport system ATP-binding protein